MRNYENGSLEHCCNRHEMARAAIRSDKSANGRAFTADAGQLKMPVAIVDFSYLVQWAKGDASLENSAKIFPADLTVT